MDEDAAPERGIERGDVVDKYKAAAGIAEQAMGMARKAAYAGMNVATMCALGDTVIEKGAASVYNKARSESGEKLERGVAFPTCVCIANCAAHFCPVATDAEAGVALSEGDVITVQMGAHVDGYAAMCAQTIVVRKGKEEAVEGESPPVEGRAADAVVAAYTAAEAVLRVLRPGKKNVDVTEVIAKVAADFGVSALEGVLSHEMKRYVIDGTKVIMNKATQESRAEEFEFAENEVYNIDIVMSTGEGKAKEGDTRETVYKRKVDVDYKLKLKTSRQIFSEINKKYPTMPFTLRALSDPKRSRMAMTEMTRHSLVVAYPVLYEREGETVARCSMTVLILPNQTMPITKSVVPAGVKSAKAVLDEDVKTLLATSIEKKKKKKAAAAAAAAAAMET